MNQNTAPAELHFQPKKDYFEPMHTAEHILNQTMVRMFGCPRSKNAHIEKNKSKCDYFLSVSPTQAQLDDVARRVNEIILQNLPVTEEVLPRAEVAQIADISKLPPEAGDMLRVIRVGGYDVCPCIGKHVSNTSEIGVFKITTWDYENGRLRLRFKLDK